MSAEQFGRRVSLLIDETESDVVVIGANGRDEFRAAELGIGFDGKMIYSRERLIEAFVDQGMEEDDAVEWISYNIDSTNAVHVVD